MKSFAKKILVAVLAWEAKLILAKYKPKIIAVTGNVGKTSTKDAIASALATKYNLRKSYKSFNSEFGVPLTIIGAENPWSNVLKWLDVVTTGLLLILGKQTYPEMLVLEVGADHPGDIENITKWLKPDIAVLTQFGEIPVHIENFPSRDAIVREKSFLPKALKKGGVFVYNGDDVDTQKIASELTEKTISFGYAKDCTVSVVKETINYTDEKLPTGFSFEIQAGETTTLGTINHALGRGHLYALLSAVAVAQVFGVDPEVAVEKASNGERPYGRMHLLAGVKDSMIIDDTYNASPKATLHALEVLQSLDIPGRKIAILGDMLELGKHTEDAHKKVGEKAASAAHVLVAVGIRARAIVEGALDAGMKDEDIFQYEKSREAGKFVEQLIQKGDVVLVKGSQGMRMERATEEIMAEPERKEELLVRQDTEWRGR